MLRNLNIEIQRGTKIRCYPDFSHVLAQWAVNATVLEVEEEKGYFFGCTVEFYERKKMRTRRIPGGSPEWILGYVTIA